MATLTEVRDAIIGQFRTAWLASGTTSSITLLYDDVRGDEPGHDANGKPIPFARVTVRHLAPSATETLRGAVSAEVSQGKELHRGQAVVQVFTPRGYGYSLADAVAQVAKRAFQRRRITGVDGWFVGVAAVEVPTTGAWAQVNVVAPFRYSEVL